MKYIKSSEDKFGLQIEAEIKRNIKGFVIVKKKEMINEFMEKDKYDLYELEESELSLSFSDETLTSFSEKYVTQPLQANEKITTISIYHDCETIREIGLPMTVVIFEPNKQGYVKEIENTRMAIKEIIGGFPEYVSIGRDDMVLVCHEEGMLLHLPKHRGFHGTFLITGLSDGWSVSLTEEQIKEVKRVFDKKENNESKSKYLKQYFDTHEIPRTMFQYSFENMTHHVGTESIIEFILSQEDKHNLQMIELEIRDIERNNRDIYPYLKSIGYQMAKKQKMDFK